MRPSRHRRTIVVLACAAAATGCRADGAAVDRTDAATVTTPAATATTGTAPELTGNVTVFAAASLTAAFTEAETAFETAHPGVDVVTSFAASSDLVTQLNEGAPADVFASADQNNMAKLIDAGEAAGQPVVFATNTLEIIVAEGNPLGITGVADLADPELILTICAPEVPCGGYAAAVFANAGVTPRPDSLEENVKSVVTKVTAGEADAGIAYATDIRAVDDRGDGVAIPAEQNVIADYPVALTRAAPNPAGGQAFIDFITGEDGQAILATYGFGAP